MWRVVCQEHAYFIASLCNAGLGNSWLAYYLINKFREISELNPTRTEVILWTVLSLVCIVKCTRKSINSYFFGISCKYAVIGLSTKVKKHFIKHLSFSYSLRLARLIDLCEHRLAEGDAKQPWTRLGAVHVWSDRTTWPRPVGFRFAIPNRFAYRIDSNRLFPALLHWLDASSCQECSRKFHMILKAHYVE